jgi:hypothetical protein
VTVPRDVSPPSPWLRPRRALGRLRHRFVWDTYDVFAREVLPADAELEVPAGYRVRFGDPRDLSRCTAEHTELSPRDREVGAQRLEIGHRLVVVVEETDTPVFTMWVNPRHLNVPGLVKRRLRPDQVFIYKAFTSPHHRGRRLYQLGMRFVLQDLQARGLRELVGYAHLAKDVSRRGLAATGFRDVGRFRAIGWRTKPWVLADATLRANFPAAVPRSGAPLVQ